MKKKDTKGEKKKFSAERLLKNDNASILKYVDSIKDNSKKKEAIDGLINYLENCLLDRDAGQGPKLIDLLKERQIKKENEIKEYNLEDLIWWKGTEAQLEYLFMLLINENLIDSTQYNERFSLIAKHFKNPNRKRYKNKQSSQAVRNLRGKEPPNAKELREIITKVSSNS